MIKTTESCQSCKFWKGDFSKRDCRRFPPVVVVRVCDGYSSVSTEFPTTPPNDWCGEYVKGEVKP